jgi:hypothetical protein
MTYNKTDWKDRVVETPLTFTMQNNPDGTVTLIPAEGQIIEAGTSINAVNMNNLERQYEEAVGYINRYGLGFGGQFIEDADSLTANGLYITPAQFIGSPFPGIDGANQGYLSHEQWGTNLSYAKQTFTSLNGRLIQKTRRKDNGVWTAWSELRNNDPVVWYDIPLWNGAAGIAGRNPKYTKEGKKVTLEGELSFPYRDGYALGGLPSGFRPAQTKVFVVSLNTATPNQICSLYIQTEGSIVVLSRPDTTSSISLNGFSFYID